MIGLALLDNILITNMYDCMYVYVIHSKLYLLKLLYIKVGSSKVPHSNLNLFMAQYIIALGFRPHTTIRNPRFR